MTLALRRHWRALVVGAVLGALLGLAGSFAMAVKYQSEASLFLEPIAGNPYQPEIGSSRSDQLVALQTEASLVATPEVTALAQARSALPLADDAEKQVKVTAPSNSQVLVVTFTAGSPEVAQAGAQAFAEGYLDYRRQRAQAAKNSEAIQIEDQIAATSAVMDQTAADLATATPDSSRALLLQQQLQVYSSQLAQLNLSLAEARAAVPSTGEVITPANVPKEPSGIPSWILVAAGLVAGLGLALLYALAREHGDDRVREPQEMSALGSGHPLARVPTDAASVDLATSAPEGYLLLVTQVSALTGRTSGRSESAPVVAVLGTEQSGTAPAVAAGIAAAAHRLGRRVLLVAGEIPLAWTGSEVVDLADPTASTASRAPAVLSMDPDPAIAEELALSTAFPRALAEARGAYDLVILSGGAGASAVGWRFSAMADRTLVIGEMGNDEFSPLLDLVETLRQSGVPGLALVAADGARKEQRIRWRQPPAPERPVPRRARPIVGEASEIIGGDGLVMASSEQVSTMPPPAWRTHS